MTGRERMLMTLRFEEPDRPPHFEAMFELEHEAFGLRFPDRTSWAGATAAEKQAKIACCMEIYERIVDRYHWDALMVYWPWSDPDGVREARRTFGNDILLGGVIGGGVLSIEHMQDWTQFAVDLVERPEVLHEDARRRAAATIEHIPRLAEAGADFIYLPSDIAFNAGPFVSPAQLREFVTPYWKSEVDAIRAAGCIPFVHSDGQLMPVLDQMLSLGAACLQSIDPMAGMDIAVVKRHTYGKLALMGNVMCSVLQDGPREAIRESVLYCLTHGSPGGGYVFGTSNTIFPGMPLENYEYMLEVYREFCAAR